MKHPKAFMLRDLVAILCLVILAVPVVAGTMYGVGNRAHLAICMMRLRCLTHAVHHYAENNNGYMPVYQHTKTLGYIRAPDAVYKTAVAFAQSPLDPTTLLYRDVRGLGFLYTQKYVHRPELFYCPAEPEARHTLEHYPTPWGSQVGVGSMFIRIGYMWNPWVKPIPGDLSNWTYEDGLELRKHPCNRPLLCDLIWKGGVTGHLTEHSALWNMAYPSGHVIPFMSKTLYDRFFPGTGPGLDVYLDWGPYNTNVRPLLPGADPNAKGRHWWWGHKF